MASFKKRNGGAPIAARKRVEENDDDDVEDAEQSSSLLNTVHDIKLGQKLRQKKLGAEFTSDGPATGTGTDNKSKPALNKKVASSSSTMLGNTQFESRVDTGLSGANPIAHEKIMEQYIKDKMGVSDESSSSSTSDKGKAVLTADDELYRLPDEIRMAGQVPTAAMADAPKLGVDDESAMTSMSISIAEVALPIGFKLRNMEETEQARQKLENNKAGKYYRDAANVDAIPTAFGVPNAARLINRYVPDTALATNRFWNATSHRRYYQDTRYQSSSTSSSSSSSGGGGGGGGGHSNTTGGNRQGQHQFNKSEGGGAPKEGGHQKRSNDDRFMQEFKKRQKF